MAHGQILANAYVRPIVFLSSLGRNTFLPLKLGPQNGHGPLYLLFVNGCHWVMPEVKVRDGVTPIPPPVLSPKATSKVAKGWINHIKEGQDIYNKGLEDDKL
jgi:hypothetical protein